MHQTLKTMKNNILLSLLLLATSFTVVAQKVIPEGLKYDLPGKFEEMEVAPGGILLVGTSDGFSAIDAHKPGLVYTYNALGKIKADEMDLIEGFPWVMLHQGGKLAARSKKVILDYITGKPIFESEKFNWWGPIGYKFFPERGEVVLWGGHASANSALGIYDIEKGKELFFFDVSDKKNGGGFPNWNEMKFQGDRVFIPTLRSIICINLADKKVEWVCKDLSSSTVGLSYMWDDESKSTFAYQGFLKAKMFKINNQDGSLVWKKPVSVSGAIKEVRKVKGGLLVYAEEEKSFEVNIYDIESGQKLWKKSFEDKGGIRASIYTDNSLIFGTSIGEVNTLNFDGTTVLKKPIETGAGYIVFELTPEGNLFYLTSMYMGIADLKSGEFVKKPVKFKKVEQMITNYDEQNKRFVVSTGNEVFFVDKEGNISKVADIQFKGDEVPNKIEFREGGILLSSAQNAMLIDYGGKEKYSVYFKAPGTSVAGKLLAGAVMAASAGMAAANAAQAGAIRGVTPIGYVSDEQRSAERSAKNFGSMATSAAAIMSQRFKATAATKNHLYILTKLDEGVGLVRINKDTGQKDGELVLKDKKPIYKIDEDFGVLYFKKEDKQIVAYDLR